MKRTLTLLLSCLVFFTIAQPTNQLNVVNEQNSGYNRHETVKSTFLSLTDIAASGDYSNKHYENVALVPVKINDDNSLRAPMSLTYYSSRTLFDLENLGLPVEDFENALVAPGTHVGISGHLDQFTNNTVFTAGSILQGIQINSIGTWPTDLIVLGVGAFGSPSKVALPNYLGNSAQYLFSPAVNSIGLDAVDFTGGTQCTIEIYDASGNLLGSVTAATSVSGVFWGVKSDTPIGEIRLIAPTGIGADNIAFGNSTQPVPVSDWAVYLGLILIIGFTAFQVKKMA